METMMELYQCRRQPEYNYSREIDSFQVIKRLLSPIVLFSQESQFLRIFLNSEGMVSLLLVLLGRLVGIACGFLSGIPFLCGAFPTREAARLFSL